MGISGNPAEVITCPSRPFRAAYCYFTPRWQSQSDTVALHAPATLGRLDDVGPPRRGSPADTGARTTEAARCRLGGFGYRAWPLWPLPRG